MHIAQISCSILLHPKVIFIAVQLASLWSLSAAAAALELAPTETVKGRESTAASVTIQSLTTPREESGARG